MSKLKLILTHDDEAIYRIKINNEIIDSGRFLESESAELNYFIELNKKDNWVSVSCAVPDTNIYVKHIEIDDVHVTATPGETGVGKFNYDSLVSGTTTDLFNVMNEDYSSIKTTDKIMGVSRISDEWVAKVIVDNDVVFGICLWDEATRKFGYLHQSVKHIDELSSGIDTYNKP